MWRGCLESEVTVQVSSSPSERGSKQPEIRNRQDETRRDFWSTAHCEAAETSRRLEKTVKQKALGFFRSSINQNLRGKEKSEVLLRCCQSLEIGRDGGSCLYRKQKD
ncbi:hypothetical protein AVEN_129073-1 [Araneus ventricosus]|uniref:Uncharacterized protein n=1 Tax=Araneus ventricosus TaxID=182803 RepID=A0A4Y2NDF3_ARAVE|nr:hypothetical protein AVEN_129073-1 [Araneus ventricosus]